MPRRALEKGLDPMRFRFPILLDLIVATFCLATAGPAQTPAGRPAFEVASIKATPPRGAPNRSPYKDSGGPGTGSPTRWVCNACQLIVLIREAWKVDYFQIAAPERLTGVEYDITANVPPGASQDDFLLMIQRLLRERIGLEARMERREENVLELVIAKGGLKMTPAEPVPEGESSTSLVAKVDSRGVPQLPPGYPMPFRAFTDAGNVYAGRGRTMGELIEQLETPISQLIVDNTGLAGKYDYYFHCPLGEADHETYGMLAIGECLKRILPEQLGLKLQSVKAMVDMLVVDHFDKQPSEN